MNSTLAIAPLFNPLRKRTQRFINHRFDRQGYEAQITLENFSANARSQVELNHLSSELIHTSQDTLKPETITLWLKKM